MFRNILIHGLIAGLVVGGISFAMFTAMGDDHDFENGMVIGYATMLVALSAVFVGIKRYRDRELGGVIRFWPAFGMGVAMSVIAGILYTLSWEASQAVTGGDFMGAYTTFVLEQARARGESAEAIARLSAEMAEFKVMYAKPWFRLPMVFSEIFPVGVLVSLVSAALLRKPGFLPARRVAQA
jgi:Protein of unknown function (DUF4199)